MRRRDFLKNVAVVVLTPKLFLKVITQKKNDSDVNAFEWSDSSCLGYATIYVEFPK